jgi:DNA-directed RNA polymerase subunit M/transcription elongation factor TFIIS
MKEKDEPRCFKCNELLVDSMIGDKPIYICPKCKWWIHIEEYNLMKKYYDKKRDSDIGK